MAGTSPWPAKTWNSEGQPPGGGAAGRHPSTRKAPASMRMAMGWAAQGKPGGGSHVRRDRHFQR